MWKFKNKNIQPDTIMSNDYLLSDATLLNIPS